MKHRLSWCALFLIACAAIYFIAHSMQQLPVVLASHFDATGYPTAFMLRRIASCLRTCPTTWFTRG